MESFGEIIRKAREEKNYILRQVSADVDIDLFIIMKRERGKTVTDKDATPLTDPTDRCLHRMLSLPEG